MTSDAKEQLSYIISQSVMDGLTVLIINIIALSLLLTELLLPGVEVNSIDQE